MGKAKVKKEVKPLFDEAGFAEIERLAACGLTPGEIGGLMNRAARSVSAGVKEKGLQLVSTNLTTIRAFGRKGGVFLREDIGGAVGVRWGRAHRSGPSFNSADCERLVELGLIKGSEDRYRWDPPAAPKKDPESAG